MKSKLIKLWNLLAPKKCAIHIVSKRYCVECGDDITNSNYALICEYCRLQL